MNGNTLVRHLKISLRKNVSYMCKSLIINTYFFVHTKFIHNKFRHYNLCDSEIKLLSFISDICSKITEMWLAYVSLKCHTVITTRATKLTGKNKAQKQTVHMIQIGIYNMAYENL